MKMLAAVLLLPSVALGASVSGRITDGTTGLAGMEVRLWAQTAKGFTLLAPGQVMLTDASGDYAFTGVAAGTFKLDTRMPNGFSGNWGDRWYDVALPSTGGYTPDDADLLVLAASDALTNMDIAVELNGGFDGRVADLISQPLGDFLVRAEAIADRRIHHNDVSKIDPIRAGEFSMRGLPLGPVRVLVHDPNYVRGDALRTGITVAANGSASIGDVVLSVAPPDLREPNNSRAAANAAVDGGCFRQVPPVAFAASAGIGPRSVGDTDWYCFDAVASDRFLIDVGGTLELEDGGVVPSPWLDPVVSFWRVDGGVKLFEDDDTGPGLSSQIDTGELGVAGPHCVGVTTFGDTAWNGTNQGSAGPYDLRVAMGNRRPTLSVSSGGQPAPVPPAHLTIGEGDSVTLEALFADPDNNLTGGTFELRDALNASVTGGSVNTASGAFTFTWTASNTAARGSPYTFTLTITDGEFPRTVTVIIEVTSVNLSPGLPELLSPDSGVTVATRTPTLVCAESYDLDEETLTYEFELNWADGGTQTGSVLGVDGGWFADAGTTAPRVSLAAAPIPENTQVSWRVRAFDGNASNGYSAWTAPWTFFVDSINDVPSTPVLTKPTDGEVLMTRRATLESTNPLDPEGEVVTLTFQVASDVGFSTLVHSSSAVPLTVGSTHTMYTVPMDLAWGGAYFARVTAQDARGGRSPASNVNAFTIRANSSPMVPQLGAPFTGCGVSAQTVMTPPTSVTIGNLADVEMDAISITVQLFNLQDNPNTVTPLFAATAQQQGTAATTIQITGVNFVEDATYRIRVRASDGINSTGWSECLFTLDAIPSGTGGGGGTATGGGTGTGGGTAMGGGSGTGGGSSGTGGGEATGGGGDPAPRPGCGCSALDPMAPFAFLLGLAALRRRARRG